MEFAANQIRVKSMAVIVLAAFFAGRINLFHGTFPAGIGLITVMLAVSTVYIYLVPVLLAGMLSYMGQGYIIWGDCLCVILLGIFFLFFHRQKFSINQRTVAAVSFMLISNLFCYWAQDILFLLKPDVLLKEAAAIAVYIRVFNTLARLLCAGPAGTLLSRDKAEMTLLAVLISITGAVFNAGVVFPLWCFLFVLLLQQRGLLQAFSAVSLAAVFWFCQGETEWEIFLLLLCSLLLGWYGMAMVEASYKRGVLAGVVFVITGLQSGGQIYGVAIAMMLFTVIPQSAFTKVFCILDQWFMPEFSTERDLEFLAVRRDLIKKKDAFTELGELYSRDAEGKEIISYQFMGMARTLEQLLCDLSGKGATMQMTKHEGRLLPIAVGQASYAFGQMSGDSMDAFPFKTQEVALMISDGMGKGEEAAAESRLVVSTLAKLLQAGFDIDLAMKTINGILMTGNEDERFATVDLTIIDRLKGRAKIFKMGAATTFIKHGDRVSMLKRQALPAGITQGVKLEYIDIKLKKGDILVMVSDGVTDCDRKDPNCEWLRERLLEIRSKDPETIAELIVNKAAEKYGIRERDDLSVMVAAIGI